MKQVLQLMISSVMPIEDTLKRPLLQAVGFISAENVISPMSVPPCARSAMDGYAVFSSDVRDASAVSPVELDVVCEIDAGGFSGNRLKRGECARVMTGAYIPEGADCVVKQEDTDMGSGKVKIKASVDKNMNYCSIGEDISEGQIILNEGSLITAFSAGVAASAGISELRVRRPLKAALISTGSELEYPGNALERGKIYNSVQYILASQITMLGLECISMQNIPDEFHEMKRAFTEAVGSADVLITTGGLSVGRKDIVEDVLRSAGAEIVFDRDDNPLGNCVMFSLFNNKPVLSLSGAPFAAVSNFEYYFRPLAARLMGSQVFLPCSGKAVTENEYTRQRPFARRLRGYCSDGRVRILPASKNSVISDLVSCNCFVELEAEKTISVGDTVKVTYFGKKQWE